MTTPVSLRLESVSKAYGSVQALKPLSLEVNAGEMLALLGPSGCGKTTTLRIIAGFEGPDTGRVLIGERDVTGLPPNRRGLGMVFQNYSLFPHMTVSQNVGFGLRMRGLGRRERAEKVRAILDLVRLGGYADREIHQLSGGQQQRVALARSLVTDPAILLLDEPLGALDRNLRERMQFELRLLQRRFGITSILVTHDQEEALTMADRIAVMNEGAIIQIGKPLDIYDRPRTRFVSEFLGAANVFAANVTGPSGDSTWSLQIQPGGGAGQIVSSVALSPGQAVRFVVRPERLRIETEGGAGPVARVLDVVFRGSYFAYELAVEGQTDPVFVYASDKVSVPESGLIRLAWQPAHAVLLDESAGASA